MKVHHLVRKENGEFDQKSYWTSPMAFVIKHIPDGVPFKVYAGSIGVDNDVTEDFDALSRDGEFYIVESAGGGGGFFNKLLDPLGVTKYIMKLIAPQQDPSGGLSNQQGDSPNNSLTDRNNKPRPYERSYDICGTVQSIPNNLMTTYQIYNASGTTVEYGYYDVGRGLMDTPASGITDGDTLMSEITGSSAAVYGPFTSPNSGSPQTMVGAPIDQGLYITVTSNEVDGATLKAPNELDTNVGDVATVSYNAANNTGTIVDPSGDSEFDAFLRVGDIAKLNNIYVTGLATLSGFYPVVSVSSTDIVLDVTGTNEWPLLGSTTHPVEPGDQATVGPQDTIAASLTQWVTISRIKPERLVVNIGAMNGMYRDFGEGKRRSEVEAEVQYQLVDGNGNPYGEIFTKRQTLIGRSSDETGMTIYADLPTPSAVRVRARRVTDFDYAYEGTIVDEIKYNNLYGQIRDNTPHYGNRTTVHTARKQTPRATSVKQPQLKMIVTEKVQKYLGGGQFDTEWTNNTQAVQSLIRLLRDPVVGGLNLTADNMDRLLAVQEEVETYFGSPLAGQFCYTFDKYETTMQDIIATIGQAIFCLPYRRGHAILLDFERPRPGPEMVFTHRSKSPSGEKWTRTFNDKSAFDSLKFSYINPETNVKETITIPADGGAKTDTYDSKGIRNYSQAYWQAWRRFMKNSLSKVSVEFTATEEGVFAVPGRPISVVKGSRTAPYDGYVIASQGLALTLSQPVEFTGGDDHSIILKKRNGSTQSIAVRPGSHRREVIMQSAPAEGVYVGNSALKTEFSFGNEQRHNAQMILVQTVNPGDDRFVKITGVNYSLDYYSHDGDTP